MNFFQITQKVLCKRNVLTIVSSLWQLKLMSLYQFVRSILLVSERYELYWEEHDHDSVTGAR